MERWLRKNLRYIAIVLFALFLIKTTQSCNRKMALRTQEKNLTEFCDSLNQEKVKIISNQQLIIDSLEKEVLTRDFMINDLTNDLKIAGVKVDAAERRADAVQRTAEKVKSNTTIQVKGVERDTTTKENLKNE